ncbi:MAG TPA: AarF/UbiB family protein [Ktedonobacteraceae bacterium]|nr:AarF/UbiB family protein [Ktedonobacteraceae bacterium]
MPERLAYDEAMRFAQIRLQIKDPEIGQGTVETITISTKIGQIVQPWGIEGGFAVVYKYRTRSGTFRALRCFRRDMDPDTQFRYEHIGPYFQAHAAHITAGFKYHPQGILIKEPNSPQGKVYPVIEMEWIEGATLLDTIDTLCQQRNQVGLRDLSQRWLALLQTMQKAQIAHGDLAGGNVMVRRDGSLVLIDYDGVYIPDFTRRNLRQMLLGQPDYQHPQMNKRPFNQYTDAFSALVIYAVLLALSWKPDLWDRYAVRGSDKKLLDTNLLLKQLDFQEPQRSALFQELERCSDLPTRTFIQELKRACLEPVDKARFPFHLVDPEKLALENLARAIQADNDTQIATTWVPVLEQYAPAQSYRARVQLARRRLTALQQWRTALSSQQIAQIASSYNAVLDDSKDITPQEKHLLQTARAFVQAYQQHDEDELLKQYEHIQQNKLPLILSPQETQRVTRLREQRQELLLFARAISERKLELVATLYRNLSAEQSNRLNPAEQRVGQLASAFLQAYQRNSDPALLAAHTDLLREKAPLTLSSAQQERVNQARQCEQARKSLRQALESRNLRTIASAYDPVLEKSTELTKPLLHQVNAIRKFIRVYDRGDDKKLLEAYQDLKHQRIDEVYPFTTEEQARLALARQRLQTLADFQRVLQVGEPRQIVASYDQLLLDRLLSREEQEMVSLAQQLVVHMGDDVQFLAAYRKLVHSPHGSRFQLKPEDKQRAETLALYEQQLTEFTKLLDQADAPSIITAYDSLPGAIRNNLARTQQEQVTLAYEALTMRDQIRQAINKRDDATIRQVYRPHLLRQFPLVLDGNEQIEVESAFKIPQIKKNFKVFDYRQVLKLAREIQREGGLAGQRPRLRQAMRRLVRETRLINVHACVQEDSRQGRNRLHVQWDWPEDDLLQYAWIFWDANRPPEVPNQLHISKKDGSGKPPNNYSIVTRTGRAINGQVFIDINPQKCIYTKVCVAMYDEWDSETEIETWCFSPAIEVLAQSCRENLKRG